jgi:hypothetical protein
MSDMPADPRCSFHLRKRLLDQGYKKIRLIRSLKKFIFRYQYLIEIYSVSAEKIISDTFAQWKCIKIKKWRKLGVGCDTDFENIICKQIKVITKLPNSEESYKGKVKTHNYINRQNQSTTGKLCKRNDHVLVMLPIRLFLRFWMLSPRFRLQHTLKLEHCINLLSATFRDGQTYLSDGEIPKIWRKLGVGCDTDFENIICKQIKVITKLPNSEESYKGKVKTHNYINRQNQSTTGKLPFWWRNTLNIKTAKEIVINT